MSRSVTFLLLCLCASMAWAQTESSRETMAVLELEAKGADPVEVSVITEELRQKIHELDRFELLERQRMKDILKEQQFSISDCATDECYVQMGQLLSVQRLVAGQVGKVGAIYSIYVRVIDVSSGRVIDRERIKASSIDDVYDMGVPELIERLFDVEVSRGASQVSRTIGDPAEVLREAGEAFEARNWERALALYRRLQEVDPANPLVDERITECERRSAVEVAQREYEAWKAQAIRNRAYYVATSKQLLAQGEVGEAGRYALMALAGDWEWEEGRKLLKDVMDSARWNELVGCNVAEAFEALNLLESYKKELMDRGLEVCQELKPAVVAIVVSESGADVFVDDEYIGQSPISPLEVETGEHVIRAKKDAYREKIWTGVIKSKFRKQVYLKMEKLPPSPGVMIIEVSEDSAEIRIGSELIGLSPVGPFVTTAGDYIVRVKKPGFQNQTKMVRLAVGDSLAVSFAMRSTTGFLTIRSTPDSARVLIDGQYVGMTPLQREEVRTGTRKVTLTRDHYDQWQETVEVVSGETVELAATLAVSSKTRGGAFVRSLIFPGWGQRYRGATNLGSLFSIAALGGLGACVYTVSQYNSKMDEYEEYNSSSNPQNDQLDRLYDGADRATKVGNIAIIATGVVWAVNVAEAALGFPAGEAGLVRVEPMDSDLGVRAMVSIQVP